jgi:tyrosinase
MPRCYLFTGLVLGAVLAASGQGIRKNYTEMTTAEKSAYRRVLVDSIYNSTQPALDIVWALAEDHGTWGTFWLTIHNQTTEESNQFLPWHRMALWEMEDAFQRYNPGLTIPYWDWRVTREATDELFQSFLSLDSLPDWNEQLWERDLWSEDGLPDSADVDVVQTETSFWQSGNPPQGYAISAEQMAMHTGPHSWVGGAMSGLNSPYDPIFYLHHGMIDKLWQEWEETNEESYLSLDNFSASTLWRYDGNTENEPPLKNPYHDSLPAVHPRDIADGKQALGVFYSEGGFARLNRGYQVSNRYREVERFIYPGVIEVSHFGVPSGKKAYINSDTRIELKSEFVSRGTLVLKVGGYDENFPSPPLSKKGVEGREFVTQQPRELTDGIFAVRKTIDGLVVAFHTQKPSIVHLEVYGANGRKLGFVHGVGRTIVGENSLSIPLQARATGTLYLRLKVDEKMYRKVVF